MLYYISAPVSNRDLHGHGNYPYVHTSDIILSMIIAVNCLESLKSNDKLKLQSLGNLFHNKNPIQLPFLH